jgi:hypothetical protein
MDAGCARTHLMREAACKALTAWTEQGGLERHPRTPAGAANALRLAVWRSAHGEPDAGAFTLCPERPRA